jgi:DNA-binding transcriptional LysR family regulator
MNLAILSKSGFSLDRLAGFCAVASAGSIVGAARGDTVRQSLLSRQIRELEEFFGTELVRRQGRGLVLTAAGVELAALGRSQITALGDFAASCQDAPVRISLAASESLLQWLVLPRLTALRKAASGAIFVLHHEDNTAIAARVSEGIHDFGLIRRKVTRGEPGAAELGVLQEILIAPRSLLPRPDLTLNEALFTLPMAIPLAGTLRSALDAYLNRQSKPPRHGMNLALECTSYLHSSAALRTGDCAAILPGLALPEFPEEHYCHWSLAPLKLERHPVSLIWNQRNAAVRPILNQLSQAISRLLRF